MRNEVLIETRVVSFLNSTLNVQAATELPAEGNRQDDFIVVEKTGSVRRNLINTATIAIQSYAKSMYDAAELNERVKEAMESFIEYSDIASCRFQSDYNYTDTRTKKYRYQAIFLITYYEKEK